MASIFADIDYRHSARVSKNAWWFRLFCWMWPLEPEEVDFCKLFWGFVLAIPNLLIRLLGLVPVGLYRFVLRPIGERIGPHVQITEADKVRWAREGRERKERKEQQRVARARRREHRAELTKEMFGACSMGADRVAAVATAAWPVLRWPAMGVGAALALLVGGAVVFGFYKLVLFLLSIATLVKIVLYVAVVAASILVVVGVGLAVLPAIDRFLKSSAGRMVLRVLRHVATLTMIPVAFAATTLASVLSVMGRGGREGGLTLGRALLTGLIGIKSRTCPKIELVD